MTDLDAPIRAAWMGIAAINIGGSTLCTLFDIPTNPTKDIKPWNANHLEEFKRKFNIDKISAIIIDEISMIKAWMLTYLDARLRQATQINEPFGKKAVIMLGDFDQQPPVAGISIPHFAMILLQKQYEEKNSTIHIKRTKQEKLEMKSQLSRTGVELFKKAGLVQLTTQHRCAEDADHIALLNKMSLGFPITPADLEPYQTLSKNDLTVANFLFATIIVTGNYKRHELNAHQAKLWAQYYHTHVI